MSERGDADRREAQGKPPVPTRSLAIIALSALANYKESGLVARGDTMHGQLAWRCARIAAEPWTASAH
jgi:hypothetical protein